MLPKRAVILSDDEKLRESVEEKSSNFAVAFRNIELNSFEYITDQVLDYNPDFIFIDLELPSPLDPIAIAGEWLSYFNIHSKFIAISKREEDAFKAIKNSFSDLLLNPISSFEIQKCLKKLDGVNASPEYRVCIKSNSDYQFVTLSSISYLQADNNATDFYLDDGSRITAFQSLKSFEKLLPSHFFRIHKSYIINSEKIVRINFGKARLTLKNKGLDVHLPISKKYKEKVSEFKNSLLSTKNMLFTFR